MRNSEEDKGQRRLGKWMLLLGWLSLVVLLAFLFQDILQDQYNPNQAPVLSSTADGHREVVLKRNRNGHYVATGRINDHEVVFLLDTGATSVAVPDSVAEKLSLKRGMPSVSHTANGSVRVWSTRLGKVALAGIERRNVRAVILPNMEGDQVLLGMSFLKHLELVQRDGYLKIRQF